LGQQTFWLDHAGHRLDGVFYRSEKNTGSSKEKLFFTTVLHRCYYSRFRHCRGCNPFTSSKAYQNTVENIKIDGVIKNEIGDIKGIGLFPSGTGFLDFAFNVNSGPSTFIITVRGSSVIKDMEITLYRSLPVQ